MNTNRDIFKQDYYLSDGGIETWLIYQKQVQLNHFASFELLNHAEGVSILQEYYQPFLELAAKNDLGFVLETPTWRANQDWGKTLGYSSNQLARINKNAVFFLRNMIEQMGYTSDRHVISGNIGPREDGYFVDTVMSAEEAKVYHQPQIQSFAYADADVITALTMTNSKEAIGVVNAAKYFGIPVVVSFTVETDGRLPSGETLAGAIQEVDLQTSWYASHYMINCAHPYHFRDVLKEGGYWKSRIKGIRANASCKSHAELDALESLDAGDKEQLARDYRELAELLPNLRVIGGCCGTDHGHMEQICSLFFRALAT